MSVQKPLDTRRLATAVPSGSSAVPVAGRTSAPEKTGSSSIYSRGAPLPPDGLCKQITLVWLWPEGMACGLSVAVVRLGRQPLRGREQGGVLSNEACVNTVVPPLHLGIADVRIGLACALPEAREIHHTEDVHRRRAGPVAARQGLEVSCSRLS
jgi:hypothetical protein